MTEQRGTIVWLDSMDLSSMTCGWGVPHARASVQGKPLALRGTMFEHGVGTHADSEVVIDLKGKAAKFESVVGVDDEASEPGRSHFRVYLDEKCVADSGPLTLTDGPVRISADVRGGKLLRLEVTDDLNGCVWAHADWCDACIEMAPGATEVPSCTSQTTQLAPPPQLTRFRAVSPQINHPRIVGSTPGKPFLFRIPAEGEGPLSFDAVGLPRGLTLDRNTGIISGSLASEGRTAVTVTVRGAAGSSSAPVTIVGGQRALALTPPMGWNSWNVWGLNVDQDKVKAAADALVDSGLAAHGFQYVNIDDGWEAGRAADGTILPNEKFPDMKGLSDYIHGKGLKLGIYSSPGPKTCGGYTGSYEHEEQDARTYAHWGVDYLKYDWCSYDGVVKDLSAAELQKPYRIMAAALEKLDRDVVFSICQYGRGRVWEWGREVGGHLWRTTGDIVDTWLSAKKLGFSQHPHDRFAAPGGWNDPDMLVLGWLGWGEGLHETRLSRHEQMAHMSLWCLLSAPLLIGCDLTRLDEWTLTLLTNDEVVALDQDPLGRQARRVLKDGDVQVWVKHLVDGSVGVGLFNLGFSPLIITVDWQRLGLAGPQRVRDLWHHEDRGVFEESFSAEVAPHGVVLVRMSNGDTVRTRP